MKRLYLEAIYQMGPFTLALDTAIRRGNGWWNREYEVPTLSEITLLERDEYFLAKVFSDFFDKKTP